MAGGIPVHGEDEGQSNEKSAPGPGFSRSGGFRSASFLARFRDGAVLHRPGRRVILFLAPTGRSTGRSTTFPLFFLGNITAERDGCRWEAKVIHRPVLTGQTATILAPHSTWQPEKTPGAGSPHLAVNHRSPPPMTNG